MNAYGSERLFPIPKEMHPSGVGYAEMKAHFKLAHIGMKSPRMYVLDEYRRYSTVLIGYIGVHPRNVSTN